MSSQRQVGSIKWNRRFRKGKQPYKPNGAMLRNWLSRKYGTRYVKMQVWED